MASGLAVAAGANINQGIDNALASGSMSAAEAIAARVSARVLGSAIRALGSPGDAQYAFASAFIGSVVNDGLGAPGAPPSVNGTVFDDDGNLMPGIVDTHAPAATQYQQLQAALRAQGLPAMLVSSLALQGMANAGADTRTLRGYFVPDEAHDTALRETLASRGQRPPADAGAEQDPADPVQVIVIVGQRLLPNALANRVGGTLNDLYQQGKALAAQGLELAAAGLSVLDIPALKDFQQNTRNYLDARAQRGGLSEVETIVFAALYAANEALMPTSALDFLGVAGNGIGAAAIVIRAQGTADELVQVVRAESRLVAAAAEARVAEMSARAQAEGLSLISARNGARGDWNAALNGRLQPNAMYLLDNGHAYVTDSVGRVVRADGMLDVSRADRNTWQQAAAGHVGGDGYDGGHLIASLFGGAGERINLVPQLSTVNRGEFREMERQWAQAVLDKKTVRVEAAAIKPIYTAPSAEAAQAELDAFEQGPGGRSSPRWQPLGAGPGTGGIRSLHSHLRCAA